MNTKKMIKILIIMIASLLIISTMCFAAYQPNSFKSKINTSASGAENVKSVGGKIVGVIQVVGTIVSVGMLIAIGIKYMMGSAEERAEYKKTLFPYFIGAILIFGVSGLTKAIYTWASQVGS